MSVSVYVCIFSTLTVSNFIQTGIWNMRSSGSVSLGFMSGIFHMAKWMHEVGIYRGQSRRSGLVTAHRLFGCMCYACFLRLCFVLLEQYSSKSLVSLPPLGKSQRVTLTESPTVCCRRRCALVEGDVSLGKKIKWGLFVCINYSGLMMLLLRRQGGAVVSAAAS